VADTRPDREPSLCDPLWLIELPPSAEIAARFDFPVVKLRD
jgi:hypothetical protein